MHKWTSRGETFHANVPASVDLCRKWGVAQFANCSARQLKSHHSMQINRWRWCRRCTDGSRNKWEVCVKRSEGSLILKRNLQLYADSICNRFLGKVITGINSPYRARNVIARWYQYVATNQSICFTWKWKHWKRTPMFKLLWCDSFDLVLD